VRIGVWLNTARTYRDVCIYFALLILLYLGSMVLLPDGVIEGQIQIDSKTQAKVVLDALTDLQQFVGTLSVGLFAGCGWIVTRKRETEAIWSSVERIALVLALVAGATSYYGLYLSRILILEMLSASVIDPLARHLQVALAIQYYGFLFGAIMLGGLFVQSMASIPGTVQSTSGAQQN
jgi:hypothetical protein